MIRKRKLEYLGVLFGQNFGLVMCANWSSPPLASTMTNHALCFLLRHSRRFLIRRSGCRDAYHSGPSLRDGYQGSLLQDLSAFAFSIDLLHTLLSSPLYPMSIILSTPLFNLLPQSRPPPFPDHANHPFSLPIVLRPRHFFYYLWSLSAVCSLTFSKSCAATIRNISMMLIPSLYGRSPFGLNCMESRRSLAAGHHLVGVQMRARLMPFTTPSRVDDKI